MNPQKVLYEGIVVGLAGAAAVAAWFFVFDLIASTPFRTPALLGAVLFDGLRDPAGLTITSGLVLKYTAVHGLAFLLFGWAIAGLFALAERDRHLMFGVFMLFCCFEVFFIVMLMILAEWLFEALAWWNILAANLLAALVMLAYLFREHRVAWREFLSAREG